MHESNHANESERRRLLILGGKFTDEHIIEALRSAYDVDHFVNMDEAMAALRDRDYHAVFSDAGDFLPLERNLVGQKANLVPHSHGFHGYEGHIALRREGFYLRCVVEDLFGNKRAA